MRIYASQLNETYYLLQRILFPLRHHDVGAIQIAMFQLHATPALLGRCACVYDRVAVGQESVEKSVGVREKTCLVTAEVKESEV